jgi:hypothetical protein
MSEELVMGHAAVAPIAAPSTPIAGMLHAVIERGITADNINGLERLVALYEREQARDAERQFAAAFAALQGEMPAIQAVKQVPNRDGTIRYKFAPYEEIMATVRPLLQRHGFTVSFSQTVGDGRISQACVLQHVGGHSRTNVFAVRIGSGPPGSSEAQTDGAASTYAKRHALCNALNITVDADTDGADARIEGAPIAADKAQYLRELCAETKSDEAAFLKFAGAATFGEIASTRYDDLVRALQKKAGRK